MSCALIFAGVLLVVIPYFLAVLAQWLHGWPNKPGFEKYLEAVKPRRVYNLTLALFEMLSYLKYSKLYLHWQSNYKNIDDPLCVKNVVYGRHGKMLDVYFPTRRKVNEEATFLPAVIFVFGGGWETGTRTMYSLLAHQLSNKLNVVVICMDYTLYRKPSVAEKIHNTINNILKCEEINLQCTIRKTTVVDMVHNVADCISWMKEHGHKYGIHEEKIILLGHSSGAHLCALTTVFLAGENNELECKSFQYRKLLSSLKGVIGLAGVYHIGDHYKHETWRGIECVSCMSRVMKGHEHFDHYSPAVYVGTLGNDSISRLPPFVLVHGTKDTIVPANSSFQFSKALTDAAAKVTLHVVPELNHVDIVMDLMNENRTYYETIHAYIRQAFQTCLSNT
ncbi:probable isoprenylcysteine alpha-carbonyl methylesterase ICMEL2 [Protopterus annectens]|uniref:probable isoprenylcysteine alpha-carbonyl methylesterase ICMEL2 n=1 Tax=Protopterus annectens TaxID=7888 RepID=UPI001CF94C08|nr:probable isoprenylcysteine alpha-carbonyl methylesterase ICMEL2 [Protopterus annectens]